VARPRDLRPLREFPIHLRYRVGRDDDLIALLEASPNMAALVTAALRGVDVGLTVGVNDDAATDDDLDALEGMMF